MNEIQLTVTGHPVRMQGASYLPRSIQALQAMGQWKHDHAEAENAWLRADIGKAFQHFLALRLGNTPAVEMLPFVAEEWVEVIGEGMTEELDRERIRKGFNLMRRSLKWWPQPADLLKVLPRRHTRRDASQCVSTERQTDEQYAKGSETLKGILDLLG